MPNDKKKAPTSLEALFGEINHEVNEERMQALPQEDQVLAEVARRMLRLERDMTMPGSQVQTPARVERLAKFIEEENF
jgi:hypothetical protein